MTVRPGAEPFSAAGGATGVLLCHGFTGSPASLRPWAQRLAAAGHAVELPLLPGHGTRWQDMQLTRWPDWYTTVERSLRDLATSCEQVYVMGLSMGGTLALRLAEQHPQTVAGLVVVNPSLSSGNRLMPLLPILRHIIAAVPGVSNDINRPAQDELAYDRVPLQALHSLTELWHITSSELGQITQPMLVFTSAQDHVVDQSDSQRVVTSVGSSDIEQVELLNSFHVATLDHDADTVIDGSLEFIQRLTTTGSPDPGSAARAT